MKPERWNKIESIFHKALDAEEGRRGAVLEESCVGDEDLRREVESLLAQHENAGNFIETPAFEADAATIRKPPVPLAAKPRPNLAGSLFGQYRIVEKIGVGGMGVVYKAEDTKLGRPAALKFLPQDLAADGRALERFRREARAASALNHPNICTIYDIVEEPGRVFIAMEYLEGQTLAGYIGGRALAADRITKFGMPIAEALGAAHAKGVIHRDIKPGNIFVTTSGLVKVLDFGVAKLVRKGDGPATTSLTTTEGVTGTLPYMSPEQLLGRDVDARSDIYSLGVVLYEMSTGRRPYAGNLQSELIDAILHRPADPPRNLNPQLPVKLEEIILKCLEKDPENRYQTAKEIAVDLRRMSSPSGTATPVVKKALQKRPHERWPSADEVVHGLRPLSAQLRPEPSPAKARFTASIAVLPFANLSAEADREYFSDGLTEELIYLLARLPNLRVVSRTSAFEFRDRPQSIRRIGEQLNVSTVLEGSVRRIGKKLRVSVQLVNVADGYCLWSQRFDREIQDVFAIQDEIAQKIADMLNVKLGHSATTASKRHSPAVEAYDCYLRGRFHWNKRSGDEFQRALESFQAALRYDPNYAPAYSGIADYHVGTASWGLERPSEAWPRAKEAAEKALAIDDTLAEAHASMGTIRMWYEWDWAKAEREFLCAIDLNPGDPKAHVQYNLLLVQTGRCEEAEREVRIALSSDPLSVPINLYLAGVFHYGRDYKRSLEQCRKALELDPYDIESHIVLGLNLEQQCLYDDAIRALSRARELSGSNPLICGPLASCYAALGARAKAMELLDEVNRASQQTYVAPMTFVMIYLGLREKDLAFQWLERAAEVHDVLICYLGVNPIYDFIRDDPRYILLLQRLGLSRPAASLTPTATLL